MNGCWLFGLNPWLGARRWEGGMDTQELSRRLYKAATDEARRRKLKFGEGADDSISNMANSAAHKILNLSSTSGLDQESLIKSGEIAFEILVDRMVISRRNISGYTQKYPNTIGEATLLQALGKLCPMWPLC